MSDGDAKPKTGSTANPQERFTVALPDHTIGLPRGSRAVGLAAGIFLALMVVAWSPWGSPSATLRAGVLAGGAGVFLPIAIVRWRRLFVHGGVGRWRLTGALVAIALAGWSLLDAILQGLLGSAPLLGSVYGWFGRGLGAVSLLSAAVVLVTFAVLTSAETRTAYACFAIAAGVSALVTCLQVAGVDVVGTVVDGQAQGLLGNADFASAVYGIAVVPSVVAAVEWVGSRRWVAAALTVVLVAGLALSGPFQGPLAAVFGLMVAVGILITLPGTPRRLTSLRVFLAALIVLAGIGAAAVILMWSQRADALESREIGRAHV